MHRQRQIPKSVKKNHPVKPKSKSRNPPQVPVLLKDDRSSVCSNSPHHLRLAGEEDEFLIREELEREVERELEQELRDGISALVRRLSQLKARQIVREIGMATCGGGGITEEAENKISGARRRLVTESFSPRDGVVNLDGDGDGGSNSGVSDAESTTETVRRKKHYAIA